MRPGFFPRPDPRHKRTDDGYKEQRQPQRGAARKVFSFGRLSSEENVLRARSGDVELEQS